MNGLTEQTADVLGWGYATVSLRTKKIKGLHENMAAKIDRFAQPPNG